MSLQPLPSACVSPQVCVCVCSQLACAGQPGYVCEPMCVPICMRVCGCVHVSGVSDLIRAFQGVGEGRACPELGHVRVCLCEHTLAS